MINIKDFGAVGNFDPATGEGKEDTKAIQAALNHAASLPLSSNGSPKIVVIPPGNYKISGFAEKVSQGGTSLALENATDLTILGAGGTLYQGPGSTRLLGIFNGNGVRINGLKLIGYTGQLGSVDRELRGDYRELRVQEHSDRELLYQQLFGRLHLRRGYLARRGSARA